MSERWLTAEDRFAPLEHTYMGGYHDQRLLDAFRHGMRTTINATQAQHLRHSALLDAIEDQVKAWRREHEALAAHGIVSDRGDCADDLEAQLRLAMETP
jgi:hypothetical protein